MESIIEFQFYSVAIYILVFCLLVDFLDYIFLLSLSEYFVPNSHGFPNSSYRDERDFVRDNLTMFELTVVTFAKR